MPRKTRRFGELRQLAVGDTADWQSALRPFGLCCTVLMEYLCSASCDQRYSRSSALRCRGRSLGCALAP